MKTILRVPNWLGDAVMARPAVDALAAVEPDSVVAAMPSVAAVFRDRPLITLHGKWDAHALRDAKADRLILLAHSFSSAFAGWRAGIAERFGTTRHGRGLLITRRVDLPREPLHQCDEYRRLIEAAGVPCPESVPALPTRERRPIEGDYVVLAPGAKYGSAKRWTGFAALAESLAAAGRRVVVLGAGGETLAAAAHEAITDLTGRTSLDEALDYVGGAAVVVSNDSGLAHAAAALGRRVVVIFGPTRPERTAPRGTTVTVLRGEAECAPCDLRSCPIDHRCMKSIRLEDVLATVNA